jgi:glucosyl-dolichyl phosphate glucuronosyltransferase
MTSPEVSIVIPTRNRAGLLMDSLESILNREATAAFEVVVVDNASDDDTASVLEGVCGRDRRVRAIHASTIGRAAALMAGMEAASGAILLFTDDDVVVEPGWVDAYVDLFERRPNALLAGGPIVPIPRDGTWPAWFSPRASVSLGMVHHDAERPLLQSEQIWGANMGARAELFERVGTWDPLLGVRGEDHPRHDPGMNEDIELQSRTRAAGIDVWYCPGARIGHRADPASASWCLRSGFGVGRNSYLRPPWPDLPAERRRPLVLAGGAWASAVLRVVVSAAAFRLRPVRSRFEAAWLASWSLGWRMEDLLRDRRRGRADAAVRMVSRRTMDVAARVTAGVG